MAQPIVAAQPYYPQVDKSVDPKITVHLQRIYPALNQHDEAIINVDNKVNSLATQLKFSVSGSTVTAPPVSSTAAASGVTAVQAQNIAQTQASNTIAATFGGVNPQATTSYTTQSTDYGGLITFNDASPIAVTLNPTVAQQWFTAMENLGAGAVTVTPGTGLINGSASLVIAQNAGALIYRNPDGTNWSAIPIAAPATGGVTSLNGETGVLTLTSTGATIVITEPTANTINLEAVAGGVASLDGITGAITLVAGSGITITDNTPAAGDITIASTGGGGGYIKGTVSVTVGAAVGFYTGSGTVTGATTAMAAVACNPLIGAAGEFALTAVVTGANTVEVGVYNLLAGGGTFTFNFPVIVFP